MLSKKIYKGMLCPLSKKILTDPVITCEGESYDRRAIEKWFYDGNTCSPVTGTQLPTIALTPNHNLRRLIVHWLNLGGEEAIHTDSPSNTEQQLPTQILPWMPRRLSSDSSRLSLGTDIEIFEQNTIGSYKGTKTAQNIEECTVFIDQPLRSNAFELPMFGIEIISVQTHTSVFQIGFTEVDPNKCHLSNNAQDLIIRSGYYYDSSGSLFHLGELDEMSHWPRARHLKPGDKVYVGISQNGNFWIKENETVVVDYPMKVKLFKPTNDIQQFWGFVTLFGTVTSFSLLPCGPCQASIS